MTSNGRYEVIYRRVLCGETVVKEKDREREREVIVPWNVQFRVSLVRPRDTLAKRYTSTW